MIPLNGIDITDYGKIGMIHYQVTDKNIIPRLYTII